MKIRLLSSILPLMFGLLVLPPMACSTQPSAEVPFNVFPISTEIEIGKRLQPILAQALPGSLVTVGSERGLREAGMLPGVEYVFLIDISEEILRFLKINLSLLKTPDLETYRHLRWTATLSDWQKVAPELTAEDFAWWTAHVRDIDSMSYRLPEELNRYGSVREIAKLMQLKKRLDAGEKLSPADVDWWMEITTARPLLLQKPDELVDLGEVLDYKTGHYLFDVVQYAHLHRLVLENRILPLKLNLANPGDLARLQEEITARKTTISVLDLDNLYVKDYMMCAEYLRVMTTLLPLGEGDSILVVMNNSKDFAGGQMQTYLGFTFENVALWPKDMDWDTYFDTLPKWIFDFLDGRLYRKGEMPPMNFLKGRLPPAA